MRAADAAARRTGGDAATENGIATPQAD